MTRRLLSATLLLAAVPAFAQAPPAASSGPLEHGPGRGMHGGPGMFGMRQPVTNAPYSATFTSTSTEKLQDGTVLTHTTTRIAARDSLGRTREEITLPAHGTDSKPHTMVMILDPVAHTVTRLDAEKKIAIVHPIPEPRPHGGPAASAEAVDRAARARRRRRRAIRLRVTRNPGESVAVRMKTRTSPWPTSARRRSAASSPPVSASPASFRRAPWATAPPSSARMKSGSLQT